MILVCLDSSFESLPELELNSPINEYLRLPINEYLRLPINEEVIVISDDEEDEVQEIVLPALLAKPTVINFKPKSNKRYNPISGFDSGVSEVKVHHYIEESKYIAWNYNSDYPSFFPEAELLEANQNVHYIVDEYSENGKVKIK